MRKSRAIGSAVAALAVAGALLPGSAAASAVCTAIITSALTGSFLVHDPGTDICSQSNIYATGGQALADAAVAAGLLRSSTRASTNAQQPDDGTVLGAVATARHQDRFRVSGLDAAGPVRLTFAIGLTGEMRAELVLAPSPFFGFSQTTSAVSEFTFTVVAGNGDQGARVQSSGCVHGFNDSVSVCNGFAPASNLVVDELLLLSLDVVNGDEVDLTLDLTTRSSARAQAEVNGQPSSATTHADFFHTARWLGLNSATVGGARYAGPLELDSDSGFDYLRGAPGNPVPLPGTALLVLVAIAAQRAAGRQRSGLLAAA